MLLLLMQDILSSGKLQKMRQRITFLSDYIGNNDTDTQGLEFSPESVAIPDSLVYKRQDRLTLSTKELSNQLKSILSNFQQVKITWKEKDEESSNVFQNYYPYGLTIHLLPKSLNQLDESINLLSHYFSSNLGLNQFNSSNFIQTPTSLTYYTIPTRTNDIESHISSLISSFSSDLEKPQNIKDFQFQYDITKDLKFQWISNPVESTTIQASNTIRKEIAILQPKELSSDLELSGIRTIIGGESISNDYVDYTPPTKTLIYVKPRHSTITYSSISFKKPLGFHPVFQFENFSKIPSPPSLEHCETFISTILPKDLFFDKYQYNDNQLKLIGSWGESDLEAPSYKLSKFGSIQLFQIIKPLPEDSLELTYHSRYTQPSSSQTHIISKPQLFHACDSQYVVEDYEHVELNPFDSQGLGIDSFFEKNTVFYHIEPVDHQSSLEFQIPTAQWEDFLKTQGITIAVLGLGIGYLIYKLLIIFNTTIEAKEKKEK